ncbi:hypothetical protein ACIOKD_36400 [Streptomyces sp. NPDC087844]|uniref:hypothetical protein n=1 Tax=Streptomyces sp. NPDC087844 TaxID=3365805 RepID=UPI0038142BF5
MILYAVTPAKPTFPSISGHPHSVACPAVPDIPLFLVEFCQPIIVALEPDFMTTRAEAESALSLFESITVQFDTHQHASAFTVSAGIDTGYFLRIMKIGDYSGGVPREAKPGLESKSARQNIPVPIGEKMKCRIDLRIPPMRILLHLLLYLASFA